MISEHSIGHGAQNPYEVILELGEEHNVLPRSRNALNYLYRIAPFTYAIVNERDQAISNTGEIIDNTSDSIEVLSDNSLARAPKTWRDPFAQPLAGYNFITQVHAWINAATGLSGHAMVVQGYSTIVRNNGAVVNTLMVADGWDHNVRFLNFNFSWAQQLRGTSFRR